MPSNGQPAERRQVFKWIRLWLETVKHNNRFNNDSLVFTFKLGQSHVVEIESPDTRPIAPQQGLIVFDFDGTITTKDTFALFLRYYAGATTWFAKIITLLPVFIAYKLQIIDRHGVKAAVIKRFFTEEPTERVNAKAEAFAKNVIPNLIRPQAMACFNDRKADLESLYICSASISPYLIHWAKAQGLPKNHVLAVELEEEQGLLTGRILGYNVWGENKVRRIKETFRSGKVQIREAYGDTRGDRELLNAAEASFFKPFRL